MSAAEGGRHVALSAFYCISSGKDIFSKNRKDEELDGEGGLRGL